MRPEPSPSPPVRRLLARTGALAALLAGAHAGAACGRPAPTASTRPPATPRPPSPATSALVRARPYATIVPSTYDGRRPVPVLVVLPGFMTEGFEQVEYFGIAPVAQAHGVLLVVLAGTRNPAQSPFWNATDACCDFFHQAPDDVAYLDAVLDDVAARYAVDPARVWLIGHSNGGFMAHRYACERAARIAGFVSLAGAGWADPGRCAPGEPVAALQIHGDADRTIAYDGGSLGDPANVARWRGLGLSLPEVVDVGPYPGALASLGPWRRRDACADAPDDAPDALDLDARLPGAETAVTRWRCQAGAVELWTLRGGAHSPTLAPGWAEHAYAFLAAHPKRATPTR